MTLQFVLWFDCYKSQYLSKTHCTYNADNINEHASYIVNNYVCVVSYISSGFSIILIVFKRYQGFKLKYWLDSERTERMVHCWL